MTDATKTLKDDAARRDAINVHDRSFLVEAGAGSGKTAVMAGRIAMMLAKGVAPKSIAAVTYTELAASELLIRVRAIVGELVAGHIATELRVALPNGLSEEQQAHLLTASASIDDITCSTIHGFCQRLIRPYPVEADIDPGASVMDGNQADLVFGEIVEVWLRETLSGDEGGIIAEMVLQDPAKTVTLIHKIVENLRRRRSLSAPAVTPLLPHLQAFRNAAAEFAAFIQVAPVVEPETLVIAQLFSAMAKQMDAGPTAETPAGLVRLLVSKPDPGLCLTSGAFAGYKKQGKWETFAANAGLSKAEGRLLNTAAKDHYDNCCQAWMQMSQNVAGHVLSHLIAHVQPVLERFRDHKRSAALLDFDDLIFAARDLLRDHDDVRRSLAGRFAHVLVDEFQDTDPLQTEIFWRLCGEPPDEGVPKEWESFCIRPGALFLVGDPKQAIYRFRGADVNSYVQARAALLKQDPHSVLSISTNFRSCAPILDYVNERFKGLLSITGQPGFTALDSFHGDRGESLCVAALDVAAVDANGKTSVEQQRDAEADAVAEMCARLIDSEIITDRRSGASRACRPGDIALLAPARTDLWRYEEALERHGIPVATQAGKRLFSRQEIQDLIALTRVLADRSDTLALVALLRGPLVGLTEEELLDIIWALPRSEADPDKLPRLNLGVDASGITHPVARATLEKLQALNRLTQSTTPHDLLSQAIDMMRVRPILMKRHPRQADRALANVDLYLSLTTAYAIRGLRAFADMVTAAWTDESSVVEGRPDARDSAVALYTMHAAKGLEWPIVVPVNTMTAIVVHEKAFTDRKNNTLFCPVLDVDPAGYEEARVAEKAELDRERIRLWYVAATRACELLVLPRLDAAPPKPAWISLMDLALANLPALDLSHLSPDLGEAAAVQPNLQTREKFAQEAAVIASHHRRMVRLAPSRDESSTGLLLQDEAVEVWGSSDADQPRGAEAPVAIQGGRERGLILHKLLEEVLTGETADTVTALTERARMLVVAIGKPVMDDAAKGLSPDELAECVARTLALPEIVNLRPTLVPEFPVYASHVADNFEHVTAGFTDATSFGEDGRPQVVIDWKSDVMPSPETIDHYRAQVGNYLDMTGTPRGLIVLMTSGLVVPVLASTGATGSAD